MINLALDIVLAVILWTIAIHFAYIGRRPDVRQYRGWYFIQAGTLLLAFGSLIDITDNFPSLNRFVIIGDTPYEFFLEDVVGYVLGCFLLGVGTWRLIPQILRLGESERALRESEEKFREFAELLPQFVYEFDVHGRLTFINQQGFAATQYDPEEFPWDKPILFLLVPEDRQKAAVLLRRVLNGERLIGEEVSLQNGDGSSTPIAVYANPIIRDNKVTGVRGVGIDITNMKRASEQIAASLQEKEILLREIHHRVKNNLQIMSSLFALQARRLSDDRYSNVFQEARNRIWAMALVHESLYRASNMSEIRAVDYIKRLTQEIHASYRFYGNRAHFELDIEDVAIRLDTSVTCGLIVNELVSNCMKHAFPAGANGRIKVSFRSIGVKELELAVSDDGIGLPEGIDITNSQTFGFFLVKTLIDGLQGTLQLNVTEGTEFRIRFEDEFSKAS